MEEGLRVLAEVKRQLGVPVLTDVHEYTPMDEVASVVDVLQTPAFLVPPDRLHPKVAPPASRSTSRRASSCRRGT
jgi:2-dehydro-3-deoxyphosphooctonate aldolase (KDO 8-P synthase)